MAKISITFEDTDHNEIEIDIDGSQVPLNPAEASPAVQCACVVYRIASTKSVGQLIDFAREVEHA